MSEKIYCLGCGGEIILAGSEDNFEAISCPGCAYKKPDEIEDSKIFLDEARYPGLTRQKASAMIEEVNEFLAKGC